MGDRLRKTVKISGNIIMLLACIFIISRFCRYSGQIDWKQLADNKWRLGIAVSGYTVIMLFSPVTYKILLGITADTDIPFRKIRYIWCKSNIYKYLPGNIFQYVGRNELAVGTELKHSEVAAATVLEILVTVVSSVAVTLLLVWDDAAAWIVLHVDTGLVLKISSVSVLLIILISFLAGKKLRGIKNELVSLLTVKNFVRLLEAAGYFSAILLLDGVLFGYVFIVTGRPLTMDEMVTVAGLFALSFCVGYVTPGAPGGIGIREAVLLFSMGDILGNSCVVTAAVVFRVISVAGDVLAFLAAAVLSRHKPEKMV